ncbi:hypothetical protein Lsai_1214 [Legionella sainthelensi]|uniref:Uncharacterized protein n=1 Tax=Legionella sainthelensi TaxID=28087 RepID=A0A0W0YPI2_9GAMM|nr:hypothetical protein [Legionella sainthelensi]KTD58607.1 hypothetical protein Lsai_1214 [Legionella sainthelensi]VEH34453.1 Uncharacterised protein [Legionella sainthelensi]
MPITNNDIRPYIDEINSAIQQNSINKAVSAFYKLGKFLHREYPEETKSVEETQKALRKAAINFSALELPNLEILSFLIAAREELATNNRLEASDLLGTQLIGISSYLAIMDELNPSFGEESRTTKAFNRLGEIIKIYPTEFENNINKIKRVFEEFEVVKDNPKDFEQERTEFTSIINLEFPKEIGAVSPEVLKKIGQGKIDSRLLGQPPETLDRIGAIMTLLSTLEEKVIERIRAKEQEKKNIEEQWPQVELLQANLVEANNKETQARDRLLQSPTDEKEQALNEFNEAAENAKNTKQKLEEERQKLKDEPQVKQAQMTIDQARNDKSNISNFCRNIKGILIQYYSGDLEAKVLLSENISHELQEHQQLINQIDSRILKKLAKIGIPADELTKINNLINSFKSLEKEVEEITDSTFDKKEILDFIKNSKAQFNAYYEGNRTQQNRDILESHIKRLTNQVEQTASSSHSVKEKFEEVLFILRDIFSLGFYSLAKTGRWGLYHHETGTQKEASKINNSFFSLKKGWLVEEENPEKQLENCSPSSFNM